MLRGPTKPALVSPEGYVFGGQMCLSIYMGGKTAQWLHISVKKLAQEEGWGEETDVVKG